jgi:hypothetical protein
MRPFPVARREKMGGAAERLGGAHVQSLFWMLHERAAAVSSTLLELADSLGIERDAQPNLRENRYSASANPLDR